MANQAAWNQGWAIGTGRADEQRAHKQALSDEEFQMHLGEANQNIANLQAKLNTLDPNSQDHFKTLFALKQVLLGRDMLCHSLHHPGALEKFGHLLHLNKGPQAQSVTTQSAPIEMPAAVAPVNLPETPALPENALPLRGAKAGPAFPASPASTAPGLETPGPVLPAGPAVKVQGPAQTPGQLKERARLNQRAQAEADQLEEAAPLSPAQIAEQQTQADVARQNALADARIDWLKKNNAPPEVIAAAVESIGGARPMPENVLAQNLVLSDGKIISAQHDTKTGKWTYLNGQPIPDELLQGSTLQPKTGKLTNAETERESYRLSHGIAPGQQLTWAQEADFLKQTHVARNPFEAERMGMTREALSLRERESAFKDFLALQKQLTPLERIIDTSSQINDLIQSPDGPGDVKLTLAFFDAIKTTGVRFTQQEQNFIIGSRGFMDGVQAKFDGGYMGTVFSPDQRARIGQIIKRAGDFAASQKDTLVGGAADFVPQAAAAAGGATPGALKTKAKQNVNGESKGTVSIAEAMKKPKYKGKTRDEVIAAIKAAHYVPVE